MLEQLRRFIAPLDRTVKNMARRLKLVQVEQKDFQILQVTDLSSGPITVEHLQNFGIVSVPPKDAHVVVLNIRGNQDHPIAIVVDSKEKRLKGLQEGEVALYDALGNYIWLKNSGNAEMKLKKLKIQNDSNELISVLVELVTELISQKTNTAIGPQTLTPETIEKLTQVKIKIESFKV